METCKTCKRYSRDLGKCNKDDTVKDVDNGCGFFESIGAVRYRAMTDLGQMVEFEQDKAKNIKEALKWASEYISKHPMIGAEIKELYRLELDDITGDFHEFRIDLEN